MTNQIYGRFCQKHDVEANWLQAKNFAPLEGEIIIYDADSTHAYPRVKIGIWDGESEKTNDMLVSNLPFVKMDPKDIDELLKNIECETLSVREADGDNIFSIAEGTRITGGSTNKDMITEMVGSLGSLTVNLQEAQAHQDMSMAFGANSDTYGAGAVAFGVNTSAGTMAYYWDAITFGDKPTIQLSTTRRSSTRSNPSYPSTVDWAKGDRVTIKTKDSNWVLAGTIESVSGNIITLDAALPFTDIGYKSLLTIFTYAMPHDRTIHNIDKPESGVISIGFGAIAMGGGYENKTRAPGMLSLALGYETLAAGSMAVAAGKNTEAGYASLAIGAEAKALGETSLAVGTKTKATGAYAIAGGQTTEATGAGSVALGVGSKATKWTAFAAGSTAIAEGNAAISLGNNTQATAEGAVALGYLAKAKGTGAISAGVDTVASGEGSAAFGAHTQATALGSFAEGGGENADVATKAIAAYAHAEGYRNIAEGPHSHAEGAKTHTIGGSSHTEGEATIAKGSRSHAGGYGSVTIGSNAFAHGENVETGYEIAIDNICRLVDYNSYFKEQEQYSPMITGVDTKLAERISSSIVFPYSHNGQQYKVHIVGEGVELYWNGEYSYSDAVYGNVLYGEVAVDTSGFVDSNTWVSCTFECDSSVLREIGGGANSTAFGIKTQAQGSNQFVLGRYNAADRNSQYALIVGNGSNSKRANAMTLDWSGNLVASGDVKAGAISLKDIATTAQDSQKLADDAKTIARTANNKIAIVYADPSLANKDDGGAKGLDAKSTFRYGLALGWGCYVTGSHGMAFGACVGAGSQQFAVGIANDPDRTYEGKKPLFMVGDGATDGQKNPTVKSNSFAVLPNGKAYLGNNKVVTENSQPKFNSITIGNTAFTEEQLKKILSFIETVEIGG